MTACVRDDLEHHPVSSAVVSATARAIARVNGIDEGIGREMVRRVASPEFCRWQARVRSAGFCVRPVRVSGKRFAESSDGRQLLYSTAVEPDRVLLMRCGNRRASVCPPCSREYKGDVWQLLRAGTAGGSKGVPESIAAHPMWFLTLTGPSFGPVHGTACGRGRRGASASERRGGRAGESTCEHGRGWACRDVHAEGDPRNGEPICPECYDYRGAVMFNWFAPELWRRFTIALKRHLAARLGITEHALTKRLRVSYAKVAEFQRRGIVHFHAILRIDGHGDSYSTANLRELGEADIQAVIRTAAEDVRVVGQTPETGAYSLEFGKQLDIRPLRSTIVDPNATTDGQKTARRDDDFTDAKDVGPVTSGMVAAYIAKYATKAAEDFGLDNRMRSAEIAQQAGLRTHVVAMILAAEDLCQLDEQFVGISRWLHMLGFRGHFTTKSRRFSVTLGSLRQARRDFQASLHDDGGGHDAGRAPASRQSPSVDEPTIGRVPPMHPCDGRSPLELDPAKDVGTNSVHVIGQWRFLGLGYTTPGDALLAAYAHDDYEHARLLAREQQRTLNGWDNVPMS